MKEIVFKTIEMKNFLSVGNTPVKVKFNRKLSYVVGWNHDANSSNGVGKTTVFFTSILYALFGDNREGVKQDSMINYYNKKGMYVKLELKFNGHEIEIFRSRKPNTFYYTIDGEKFQNDRIKETEKRLNEYLGISEDIFKNIFIINASDTIEFIAESGSVKLREKFEKIFFRDVIFKRILETVRKELNNLNVDIAINKKSETEKQDFLGKLTTLLMELKESGNFDEYIEKAEGNIEDLTKKLGELKMSDTEIKRKNKLTEIYQAIDAATIAINSNDTNIHWESKEKQTLTKYLKMIHDSNGECPVCTHKLTDNKLKSLTEEYDGKIEDIETHLTGYRADLKEKKDKSNKLGKFADKFEQELKRADRERESTRNDINNTILVEKSNIEHYADKKKGTRSVIKQYKDIKTDLDAIIESNEELGQNKIDLELINSIFNNQDGILVYFIKKVINNLNVIIHKFIKRMQLDFVFQFDERLNLNFNINESISIGNFSSGEQKAINFIVFFSLMEFFFKYIGLKSSIVVIDESKDTSLSENKINLVFEIFKEFHINNKIGIYFLSHDYTGMHNDVIEFDSVVHLMKKANFTTIDKIDTK